MFEDGRWFHWDRYDMMLMVFFFSLIGHICPSRGSGWVNWLDFHPV
jgi:hypothetical protein